LTPYFYKNIYQKVVYVYTFMKVFFKTIYGFHISKFNNLKIIHDLYSQYLIQTLSKMTFIIGLKGV